MSSTSEPQPRLIRFYQRYLDDENSARFIADVAGAYRVSTLARLATGGDYVRRRASVLAIGFLGDIRHNDVLGEALRDEDRGVRVLAENGIRDLWRRDGSPNQQRGISVLLRLNSSAQFVEAESLADDLLSHSPRMAEAWNQRGVARFHQDRFDEAIDDCRRALELNRYHFEAAIGMAYGYLEIGAGFAALDAFRQALRMHPDMEDVRAQARYLERTLKEAD